MLHFQAKEDIPRWIKERGPTGLDDLRAKFKAGKFLDADDRRLVAAYLDEHDAHQGGAAAFRERERRDTEVTATVSAAASAGRSAKWAGWALVFSIISLAGTVAMWLQKPG